MTAFFTSLSFSFPNDLPIDLKMMSTSMLVRCTRLCFHLDQNSIYLHRTICEQQKKAVALKHFRGFATEVHKQSSSCLFSTQQKVPYPTGSVNLYSTHQQKSAQRIDYLDAKDKDIFDILSRDMVVHIDFLSAEEEDSLLNEADRYMKRLRYEFDHWDNAIHGYRETEMKNWNENNTKIIKRVQRQAFQGDIKPLAYVHVLDIAKEGYIKPHVDAVRFCGDTIAGMCLLSSCVMRLALEKDISKYGDVYLPRRSLYIMRGKARYEFTHEVLKAEESIFKNQIVPRERRISVMCRNEPNPADRE